MKKRRKKLYIWRTLKDIGNTAISWMVILWLLLAATSASFKGESPVDVKSNIWDKVKDTWNVVKVFRG